MFAPTLTDHEQVKSIRQRGTVVPSQMAMLHYLRELEAEMMRVNAALSEAWLHVDSLRNYRKAQWHMDAAQQRMHRVIKKLSKRVK